MYASVTRTTGAIDEQATLVTMAGETLVAWLREIEGWEGLLMLTDESTGTTLTISLWESREVAERHREARMRMRDRVTAAVEARVEETVYYDVPFARLPGDD